MNRGEGGQNLLRTKSKTLSSGVVRTQDSFFCKHDATTVCDQYFTRSIDFGFTTSLDETPKDWGHDKILADTVW